MKHPQHLAARYARGENISNPDRLFKHLSRCEQCSGMVDTIQELIIGLREEGKLIKERPPIEAVLNDAGFDPEHFRELVERHFQKGRKLQEAISKLPQRLDIIKLQKQYDWYVEHLCADRIVDPRGFRVRFFPATFIHLAQIKNEWGHEPKNYWAAIEKIQKGHFHSRGGGHMVDAREVTKNIESHERRTGELPWAKLIASEPTWIFKEVTRSPKIGTEAYVKKFGTDDYPFYRVLICKVKGLNRDAVTVFARRQIDTNELRNQLWPTPTTA